MQKSSLGLALAGVLALPARAQYPSTSAGEQD